jgi:glycosyltransferase involved in cell wall biosynthesis
MDVGYVEGGPAELVQRRGARSRPGDSRPVTVCFPFAGGVVGGSHVSAIKLIRTLDRRRYEPLILLHRREGPLMEMLQAAGLGYEMAPSGDFFSPAPLREQLASLARAPRLISMLARFLRDRGVGIVHTNEGAMHVTWGIPARIAGAKLLWHHRSDPHAFGLRFLAPWLADRVVSVSRFASPMPGMLSAASRCTVIHSPFDTGIARPDRRQSKRAALTELGLDPDTRILGFFGNLADRKRPILFVEVIAAIRRRQPNMPLVGLMFGDVLDFDLEQKVRARIHELSVQDNVRLMGFRLPSEPWMAACDALVVTAVDEPFGRTLIEAMLLGTPVVAADSGGNPEAIRHDETGLLAVPDQPESFAHHISQLLRHPDQAQRLSAAAYEDAMARFGVERHSRSITEVYQQLVAA